MSAFYCFAVYREKIEIMVCSRVLRSKFVRTCFILSRLVAYSISCHIFVPEHLVCTVMILERLWGQMGNEVSVMNNSVYSVNS